MKITNVKKKFERKISNFIKLVDNVKYINQSKALVLLYHRVCNLDQDPQLLTVTPNKFDKQLEYLKNNYYIITLRKLFEDYKNNKIEDNSIVITFDDGYYDNYKNALPILEKHKIPATIFISYGYVGNEKEFWWDELEQIFYNSCDLPKKLELEISNRYYIWNTVNKRELNKAYKELHPLLKNIIEEERNIILHKLLSWANKKREVRESHRILTENEIIELNKSNLIEIGAHTVSHTCLSCEISEIQEYEIYESKNNLERLIREKVIGFSYPFGTYSDYNKTTINLLKKSNFKYAVANNQGIFTRKNDIYSIPRLLIRNWDINKLHNLIKSNIEIRNIFNYFKINKRLKITTEKEIKNNLINKIQKNVSKNTNKIIKNRYNILHINTLSNVGGAAIVANNLHQYLRLSESYKSRMLVDSDIGSDDKTDVIFRVNNELQKDYYIYQNEKQLLDFGHLSSFTIKDHIYFKTADIIHLHNLHGNYFNPFALPEISSLKPCIWTLHDMQSFTGHCAHSFSCNKWKKGCGECPDLTIYPALTKDTTNEIWKMKKKIYLKSNITIVCPSKWLKKKVEESILNRFRIELIYNGIDTDVFYPFEKNKVRKDWGIPIDKKIYCFSANGVFNNPWKGGGSLLEIVKYYRKNSDILFLIIGDYENWSEYENVISVGYIEDKNEMAALYSASDLFIYPSKADNCPLVVLEAMATGTPVVSCDVGGIKELIDHMRDGFIANKCDVKELISGIDIISKEIIKKEFSKKCYNKILDNFTLKIMCNKYINLYQETYETFFKKVN